MKNLILVAILVLAATMLACGGGDDPTATPEPTVAQSSGASSGSTAAGGGGEPTILGECSNGVVMQPGEGCSFEGDEGRPADLDIWVGADGSICRGKGSVMMSGFMVGVNEVCAEEYEVIDVFEAEISFEPNGDGSWTVTTNQ